MPTIQVKLPPYVIPRARKDGTFRVLFEVPARLRPPGWPPTIPTPPFPHRTGRLDAAEIKAIEDHVLGPGGLLQQLYADRSPSGEAPPAPGSAPFLAALWAASWERRGVRVRTQAFYRVHLAHIIAWSARAGHPPVEQLRRHVVKHWLESAFGTRPGTQKSVRATLSALLTWSFDNGHIGANPIIGLRLDRDADAPTKRAVTLWGSDDVEAYAAAARAAGWPGGEILLRLMWETAADQTDISTWRLANLRQYDAVTTIQFVRGKTGEPAEVAVSAATAALIRDAGQLFLVVGRDGTPYGVDDRRADKRRWKDLNKLRQAAVAQGARRLLFDHLRHSAATHAVENGAPVDKVPALTAHRNRALLDAVYVRQTFSQMLDVQRARGIVD